MDPSSKATAEYHLNAYLAPDRVTRQIGGGLDGLVYFTSRGSVVKIHEARRKYERELAVYQRLTERAVVDICGCSVPQYLGHDSQRLIIEMTAVSRPCLLDFAQCEIDPPPDFDRDWREEYVCRIEEDFEDQSDVAFQVHGYLLRRVGVYHRDLFPRNLQLDRA